MPEKEHISLTTAAIILGVRYQRARDEMTKGNLGEPIRGDNGRYLLLRSEVERRKREIDAEKNDS